MQPRAAQDTVGVVGLGTVGLPLAAAFARSGVRVLGFDHDGERLALLGAGRSPLAHLDASLWGEALEPTADLERVGECGALFLCLPTPLGADGRPDLAAIESVGRDLAGRLSPERLVVLTSTVPPGATRGVLLTALGGHQRLAFSPEREDPGSRRDACDVPRLVAGLGESAREEAAGWFARAGVPTVAVSSVEVAEAAKLWENLYRSTNVALANELGRRFSELGLDPFEVLEAAATKPFGFAPFTPGPGPGGPCIPFVTRFVEAVSGEDVLSAVERSHRERPAWVVERLRAVLAERSIPLGAARVLVLGVAYKPGVADVRGSAGVQLLRALEAEGCEVAFHDPLVDRVELPGGEVFVGRALEAGEAARFDAVLALHVDPRGAREVVSHARLVLDATGRMRDAMAGDPRWRPA